MNLLSFIFPQTVYKTTSKFSGEIKVIDHIGERRLSIGGLTQSGGILTGMYKQALKELSNKNRGFWARSTEGPKNVLILGFAAGTIAKLINQRWPKAKITGVEIDPEIITIAKKYFELEKLLNTKIEIIDAVSFVEKNKLKKKDFYDLIIVDLYNGYVIEKRLQNLTFLKNLRSILSKDGFMICNVLTIQKTHFEATQFLDKLQHLFQDNFNRKILTNTFIFSSK
jgi:phospholipid N-methyltransferase